MNIDKKDIEQYLSEVKEAVENDRYRLEQNDKRQDNINLFLDYVINEAKAKEIILSLTAMDFSEILQNEHKGFEVSAYILFSVIRRQTGGDYYGREGKKRFLYKVQKRDRVPFAKEEHCKKYQG